MRPALIPALAIAVAMMGAVTPGLAQDRIPSHCIALAAAEPLVVPVALNDGLEADSILIRYIDHASFAIVAADGTVAVTDYTGYIGTQDIVPDVVTMNNAHSTHWTANPDPRIPHVLRGWGEGATPADHRLDLGSMLVRNVTTDTRAPLAKGRGPMAIRSSSLRLRGFASAILATCIRSRPMRNMPRSGGWMW